MFCGAIAGAGLAFLFLLAGLLLRERAYRWLAFGILAVVLVSLWRGVYALLFVQPNFQQRALVLNPNDDLIVVRTLKPNLSS